MALGDETPGAGRHRAPPRPTTRVDKDSSIDLAQAFDVFTTEVRALNATMTNMRRDLQANLDAQARFSTDPSRQRSLSASRDRARADRPSETYDTLAGVVQDAMSAQNWMAYQQRMGGQAQGASQGPGFRYGVDSRRPLSGTEAMQSMGHFQAYAAQQLGQWIAGPQRDVYHRSLNAPQRPSGQSSGTTSPQGTHLTAGQVSNAAEALGATIGYQPRHARDSYVPRHARPEDEGPEAGAGAMAAITGRIGSAIAQSGGTSAGMRAALRRVPYVGIAIEAVSQGRDFYIDQREQARQYQEMTGSTGWEGWQDARREDIHALTNWFQFSGDRARAQFQTATALGFNDRADLGATRTGRSRGEALEFMDTVYHSAGIDTDEAGQILDVASRNTQTNLTQLARTLERLSDSAGTANINAMKVRDSFLQVFDVTTQRGYGTSAAAVGEILTGAQISYGKTFEDVDLSGVTSQQQMMIIAGQTGMGYGEVQGMLRNDPTAYSALAAESAMELASQINPEFVSAVRGAIQGQDISNPSVRNRIKEELLGPGGPLANMDLETLSAALSQFTGFPMNREQLVDWAITEFGGQGIRASAEAQEERQEAFQAGTIGEVAARGGGSTAGQEALQHDEDLASMSASERQDLFDRVAAGEATWGETGMASGYRQRVLANMGVNLSQLSGPGLQYDLEYLQQGKQDPFLEELIRNLGNKDPLVEIETSDGEKRVMTVGEAIKAGYGDLLASGNVRFVEEEFQGQTTADVAGTPGRGDTDTSGFMTNEELEDLGAGEPFSQWSEGYRGTPYGTGSQTSVNGVTIGLNPDAQRLFQIINNDPNRAAMSGSPVDMGDLDSSRYPSEQPR